MSRGEGEREQSNLAGKLSAQGRGRIPVDVAGELALDLVLNEIVEQACLATCASGAAIALRRGEEMVCRATTGGNAPELGSRLDTNAGLSGACVRSRQIQCCHDALTDPRADAIISRRMRVRSVVVYPVLRGDDLIGVVEIFSPLASVFGERDLRTLEVLAQRVLRNTEARDAAAASIPVNSANFPARPAEIETTRREFKVEGGKAEGEGAEENSDVALGFDRYSARRFDWFTALAGVVIVCITLVMGAVFGTRAGWLKIMTRNHAARVAKPFAPPSSSSSVAPAMGGVPDGKYKPADRKGFGGDDMRIPAGGLSVYENGREIFRLPPSTLETAAGSRSEISRLSPDAAKNELVRRVAPLYPEQALLQKLQGSVLLRVRIGDGGDVQQIDLLEGNPVLAKAAITAVKQWRFTPHVVDGSAVAMETQITIKFALPSN